MRGWNLKLVKFKLNVKNMQHLQQLADLPAYRRKREPQSVSNTGKTGGVRPTRIAQMNEVDQSVAYAKALSLNKLVYEYDFKN